MGSADLFQSPCYCQVRKSLDERPLQDGSDGSLYMCVLPWCPALIGQVYLYGSLDVPPPDATKDHLFVLLKPDQKQLVCDAKDSSWYYDPAVLKRKNLDQLIYHVYFNISHSCERADCVERDASAFGSNCQVGHSNGFQCLLCNRLCSELDGDVDRYFARIIRHSAFIQGQLRSKCGYCCRICLLVLQDSMRRHSVTAVYPHLNVRSCDVGRVPTQEW